MNTALLAEVSALASEGFDNRSLLSGLPMTQLADLLRNEQYAITQISDDTSIGQLTTQFIHDKNHE